MSTTTSGIDQNVTNLGVLINRIGTFPNGYNPSRNEFTIPALLELKTNGELVIAAATTAKNQLQKAIADRNSEFSNFGSITTRAINAFRISGAPAKTIEQGESIVREVRGQRASEKHTEEEIAAAKEEGKELKNYTQHNSDFDSRVSNFGNMVKFFSTVDQYKPNETDLTIDALNTKHGKLKSANDNYNQFEAAELNARLIRDNFMSNDSTGLVDIALGVKLYVKSAYGATSSQFKSISDIKFYKPKR